MRVQDVRRTNLRALLDEFRADLERTTGSSRGASTRFAKLLGTTPTYLSNVIGPNASRDVGHELARRAEQAFRRPEGWLDNDHAAAQTSAHGRRPRLSELDRALNEVDLHALELARQIESLPDSVRSKLSAMVEELRAALAVEFDPRRKR